MTQTARRMRQLALSLDGVTEDVACEGTALESRSFKAGKKAFLFLRDVDGVVKARVKLDGCLKEANALARKQPKQVQVGKMDWVALEFSDGDAPAWDVLKRFVEDSHHVMAPAPPAAKKSPIKKKATRARR